MTARPAVESFVETVIPDYAAATGETGSASVVRAADGVSLTASLRPSSGEELAAGLRVLSERGMAALVCGGGSRLGQGNRLHGDDIALEATGLDDPDQ